MIKKISIRRILILGMPGLVMGIISLIILSTYFSSKPVFTDHAHEIMNNISSYTIDKSRSHLNPARDAALLTSGLAVNKIVTSSDKNGMENYFYEQLMVNTQFSSIYYGTVEGEFVMVSRRGDEGFLTKIITITEGIRQVQFKKTDLLFNEQNQYYDPEDTYDPRERPWFKDAIEKKKLIWTNPYVFFTSRNPGITTASPVYNLNQSLHGVVGVDIEISELSDFLSTLSIGKSGKAFILDQNGQVLAYPDKDKITHLAGESDSVSLVSIADLDDSVSLAAYNTLQTLDYKLDENKELFFTFKYGNETYHAMFAPFKASYWPWLLGIYIPENDYLGLLKKNRTYTVLISFSLGLITILIGFFITRSIVRPLEILQKAAKEVGSGKLNSPIEVQTYYRELDETARIFEKMRFGLEEKAKIEEQLQQTQKVESIGRLAGGVAHDLNNLLTPILGYSEILLNKMTDEPQTSHVRQIFKAGSKAKDLVQQLLAFSRKQNLDYKPLDLNKIIRNFEKLIERTIREDIVIEINESPIPPVIMADPGQIEQVVLNLSVNAQDAMADGGVLTIEISVVEMDDPDSGTYALLAISDTGCGMDREVQNKIFEPFFSTKGDFGIGLGLATVYGIVNQHKGMIHVYSELDRGTTFKIYLPISKETISETKRKREIKINKKGSETILVAEDNEQVKDLTVAIIKSLGYKVLSADNGSEALSILSEYDEPVHLLLTDVIMPGINGKDLFSRAKLIHKDLKVLFMSGYAATAIAHHNVIETGAQFIQKPFSTGSLAQKIREVLDKG
ncbi:MAG: response regulator [Spirochaetaceae bacterium]|nr:response regulator [Spirochaetaceae bacterium]